MEFVCDRFVYSIGQDSSSVKSLLKEVTSDLELIKNKETDIPLGLQSKDEKVKFWGAAASTVSPWVKRSERDIGKYLSKERAALSEAKIFSTAIREARDKELKAKGDLKDFYKKRIEKLENKYEIAMAKYQIAKITRTEVEEKTLNQEVSLIDRGLRDWIVSQRIARDAEWPGVMPPSRTQVRESVLIAGTELLDEAERLEQEAINLDQSIKLQENRLSKIEKSVARINAERKQLLSPPRSINTIRETIKQLKQKRMNLRVRADKLRETAKQKGSLSSINLNLDDLKVIDLFLKGAGVENDQARSQFINAILIARHKTYLTEQFRGIDKETLEQIIQDCKLGDKVELRGHSSLAKKTDPYAPVQSER